jgi:phosphonate transport system substrate-binding protein
MYGASALAAWPWLAGPAPARAQADNPRLTLGVLPNVSARLILNAYQPMREHIERALQRPVEVVTAPDFRTFSQRTLEGAYDIVVIAPNLGRVAQLDANWEPLAIYEPRIPAVAVALKDNRDDSPAQLRGKALALANPQSLVALVGLEWLRTQGLQAGRDFRTVLAANDDSLGAVLRSGESPLAMMSLGEFNAKPTALRESLRVVSVIARVPGFLVMGNPRLPPELRQHVRSLMLGFPATEDGRRFFSLAGFANIRAVEEADLRFLDPYNDTTRQSLGLKP